MLTILSQFLLLILLSVLLWWLLTDNDKPES